MQPKSQYTSKPWIIVEGLFTYSERRGEILASLETVLSLEQVHDVIKGLVIANPKYRDTLSGYEVTKGFESEGGILIFQYYVSKLFEGGGDDGERKLKELSDCVVGSTNMVKLRKDIATLGLSLPLKVEAKKFQSSTA